MVTLSSLPPEITREILHHLPIYTLLQFGLTSRLNHTIQACSMSSLRLGVFHSRLGGKCWPAQYVDHELMFAQA